MTRFVGSWLILFVSCVVPSLVQAEPAIALNDHNPEVRRAAVTQLRRVPATQAIPLLCLAMNDRDKTIVFAAYDALREHALTAPNELLHELNHPLESVRFGLLRVIVALPSQSIDALPLQTLLFDASPRIRLQAVQAIARHHQQQPVLRESIRRMILDPSTEIKQAALDCLDRFDE